jgi:hypothetical protein
MQYEEEEQLRKELAEKGFKSKKKKKKNAFRENDEEAIKELNKQKYMQEAKQAIGLFNEAVFTKGTPPRLFTLNWIKSRVRKTDRFAVNAANGSAVRRIRLFHIDCIARVLKTNVFRSERSLINAFSK